MKPPRHLRLLSVCLLGALLATLTPVFAAKWASYDNPRFGYHLRYPSDVFTRSEESQNGDGITLYSPDGQARLLVFGGHNALGQSAREMAQQLGGLDDIREVTYRRVEPHWIVLSGYLKTPQGTEGPVIFYERVEFNDDRSAISGFRLEYPVRMRDEIDDLIGPIGRSLTPPRPD